MSNPKCNRIPSADRVGKNWSSRMSLKLGKLPDRTPVKLSIAVDPDLHTALMDYAAIYEQSYGSKERIESLAPFMLDGFLNGDVAFRRARKQLHQSQKEN